MHLYVESLGFILMTVLYFAGLAYAGRHARRRGIREDEYPSCLAMVRQCSVYHVFQSAGKDWNFSQPKVNSDFNRYLREGFVPRYVAAFSKRHVQAQDVELYKLICKGL